MPKYLLLKHYRGGPEPHRPVPPMDQWVPPTTTPSPCPSGSSCRICAGPWPRSFLRQKAQRWDPAEIVRVLLAEEASGRDAANLRTRRHRAAFPTGKIFHVWNEEASSIPIPTQTALRIRGVRHPPAALITQNSQNGARHPDHQRVEVQQHQMITLKPRLVPNVCPSIVAAQPNRRCTAQGSSRNSRSAPSTAVIVVCETNPVHQLFDASSVLAVAERMGRKNWTITGNERVYDFRRGFAWRGDQELVLNGRPPGRCGQGQRGRSGAFTVG